MRVKYCNHRIIITIQANSAPGGVLAGKFLWLMIIITNVVKLANTKL